MALIIIDTNGPVLSSRHIGLLVASTQGHEA